MLAPAAQDSAPPLAAAKPAPAASRTGLKNRVAKMRNLIGSARNDDGSWNAEALKVSKSNPAA